MSVPLPREPLDDGWSAGQARKELVRARAPELGERTPRGGNRRKGTWVVECTPEYLYGTRRPYVYRRRGLRSREEAERWAKQHLLKYHWHEVARIYDEAAPTC